MAKKEQELLTQIDNKMDILLKFGDKLDNYILDDKGFPIADLDENGEPKRDKNGDIIYLKKEKEKSKKQAKPGFSVRYKSIEERAIMQGLASKYNDSVNARNSYNEYVRKVTTTDVYKQIADLELKLKIAENKIKDLEQALGMTVAELRKQKKGKKQV
ncbi:hypothetical protein [Gemella sanguinis]|jgi:hypothetical protein|uniref:hypothetical protein n=1 Tax=Gemella sanguinis TaxID=84135 RepID=UPI0004E122BE|nr:hypothetical protein [Gemella sanguinis]